MDLSHNYPTSDLRQFLYPTEGEAMMQFLAVLPDGGTVNRFQKDNESYEDLKNFIESAKYVINLTKPKQEAAKSEEL
jgi:hypothetical protein